MIMVVSRKKPVLTRRTLAWSIHLSNEFEESEKQDFEESEKQDKARFLPKLFLQIHFFKSVFFFIFFKSIFFSIFFKSIFFFIFFKFIFILPWCCGLGALTPMPKCNPSHQRLGRVGGMRQGLHQQP